MQNSSIRIIAAASLSCLIAGFAIGNAQAADEQRALIARDICVGVAAKFANAPPGSTISFQSGQFRVQGANGSLTVFEGAVRVADIPGFNYSSYNNCLDMLISGFERGRRASEARSHVEAFSAGYEISEVLNIGICVSSAARGGFYYGDMENNNVPIQQQRMQQLAVSVSKSIARRMRRLTNAPFALDLSDDLDFYHFYQDRSVPYFPRDVIESRLDDFNDAIPGGEADYAALGQLVGRMKREYIYGGALITMLQSVQFGQDERAVRAKTYFPTSLNCLLRAYDEDSNRLSRAAGDLDIEVPAAPRIAAFSDTNSSGQFLFDKRVTGQILGALRGE